MSPSLGCFNSDEYALPIKINTPMTGNIIFALQILTILITLKIIFIRKNLAFQSYGRRFCIPHRRPLADVNTLFIVAELNRDAVWVIGINRMDKTMVYNIRHFKPCCE